MIMQPRTAGRRAPLSRPGCRDDKKGSGCGFAGGPGPATLRVVSEVDEFLADILPRLREAEIALHNGDADARTALWSHNDPVTLFGAEVNRTGWSELAPTFGWLATRFTRCASLEYEVVAAGASGDLAYLVAIERISATVNGEPTSYALRATTIFRREEGVWKVVHRHGDPYRQDAG